MSLALYFDQNANGYIERGLRRLRVDVLTAHEDGAREWSDERLFARASELGRVLFTHDDDFLRIAVRAQREGHVFPGVIYLKQRTMTVSNAINELALIVEAMPAEEIRSQIIHLPL